MTTHRDQILDQFTRQAVPFSTAAPIRDEGALRLLVEATGAGPDDSVLDVACGPGLVVCAFAQTARHVTGIDLTPAMLDRGRVLARQQGLENIEFQEGDVTRLPFADASFSIVVTRFAFHHFENPATVLAEMRRVCRPGGRVAVADLTIPPNASQQQAFHRMEMLRDPSHARALTLDELRGLLTAAGFAKPRESYWKMEIEVEALMERSFPAPGSEGEIRRMFADAVDTDAMGLNLRRQNGQIWFTYSNVVLVADR